MITGPNTVNDGLVFGYDADDRSTRFYPGEPTTNLLKKTTDFSTGWTRTNVTTTLQTNVKNPFGLNENVYLWSTSNSTNHQLYYYGIGTTEQRVFSCYAKKTLHKGFYLYIYNDGYVVYFDLEAKKITSTVGTGVQGYIDILDNDWCRCSIYAPKATVEVHIGFLDNTYTGTSSAPYAISTAIGTEGLIFGPQFEFNTHPTAYLPNPTTSTISRTTTQSLIDLKRNVTIDVSNLNFNWESSPYFYDKGISLGSDFNLNNYFVNNGSFTIEAYIKVDLIRNRGAIFNNQRYSSEADPGGFGLIIENSPQKFGLNLTNSTPSSYENLAGIPIQKGKYQHITYVYEPGVVKSYLNGILYTTNTNSSYSWSIASNPSRTYIGVGTQGGWGYVNGMNIKILKVYNKSLTESEILQNYNASKGRFELENRLSDGLVLHLDAGNKNSFVSGSTTWYDLVGVNNGTLTNGPTFNNIGNGSLTFDGVDDYISFSSNNIIDNLQKITISLFVNISSGYGVIASKYGTNKGFVYYAGVSTVKQRLYINSGSAKNSNTSLDVNIWNHIAISYDGVSITFYKNGVLDNSEIVNYGNINPTTDIIMKIGNLSVEPLNGKISNFRLYNRALSSTEISQLFEMERGRYGI